MENCMIENNPSVITHDDSEIAGLYFHINKFLCYMSLIGTPENEKIKSVFSGKIPQIQSHVNSFIQWEFECDINTDKDRAIEMAIADVESKHTLAKAQSRNTKLF
jgi:hypothetical protein